MIKLLRAADKRIILINLDGLSVYALHQGMLTNIARFSDEDSGHDNFRRYLAENPKTAVTLLVDTASEDFAVDTVAHVGAMDRRQFLERKAEQHFRGVEFRSARIIGREDSGRRQDRVLFSGIARNQIVEPWIRALLAEEIPVRAITTPAYALCRVAREFSLLTSDYVLLVNWEPSGIRQTYIARGKTVFSRLTPLPRGQSAGLALAIIESCNQSREYLEHIELLGADQRLDVHIITPHWNDSDFDNLAQSQNFRLVMHHNSIDMMQIDRFSGAQRDVTAVMLCLDWGVRSGELANIYGSPTVTRFYQLSQIKRLLVLCSLALVLLTGLLAGPLLEDGVARRNRLQQAQRDLVPVQGQYEALRAQFPETPIPSEAMELAVRTHDVIRSQVRAPFALLGQVSTVLAAYPGIELTGLEWRLAPGQANQNLNAALLANQSLVNLDLYGVLLESSSVQDSDTRLRQFMDALEGIGGVTVAPLSLPVEPDPFSAVNTVINDELVDAEFALNIRLDS